jgi:hypothetical protein
MSTIVALRVQVLLPNGLMLSAVYRFLDWP